jgi:hypothetical protein
MAAITLAALTLGSAALAQSSQAKTEFNYEESKVPAYSLPPLLKLENGQPVTDAKTWHKKRRPEILSLFETHVYGRTPRLPRSLKHEVTSVDRNALGGLATRKEITVQLTSKKDGPAMHILIYLPNAATKPAPAFLGLNFTGNHAIHSDPGITLSSRWMRPSPGGNVVNNRATEQARGSSSNRWPVETILARGYALATIYYGDLEPDSAEGWKQGLRGALQGEKEFQADDWGAIGVWAWGLSRALDYFEKDQEIDAKRVAVIGHSRLGKTSLWAGARDERFAIVISNESGCGGAALSRRRFGETVQRINTSFPHWFCGNFKKYNGQEDQLPVDQHQLIALMAPRPVYVASAEEDRWADPRGEFLSAKFASPVYELFGKRGIDAPDMPPNHQSVGDTVAYHIRAGKHDVTDYDWQQYLNFADRHLGKASAGKQQ